MTFLINCSNLKFGGGRQVAESVCEQLRYYDKYDFIVVLSSYMTETKVRLGNTKNVTIYEYNIKNSIYTLLGKDLFLDNLVNIHNVNAVLTIFGPSRWRPRVPHLCGFARAQLVLTDSPYYKRLSLKEKIIYKIWTWFFRQSSNIFYTENKYISDMLPHLLGNKIQVHTVSNYYNQVFDMPELWNKHPLPPFEGTTCISISLYSTYKNFEILIEAADILELKYPDFKFRFVLTFDKNLMSIPKHLQHHFLFIGKVDISECPDLYNQADIMVMPTLLECFTATYPEAMRMEIPIVTTDLEFAKGLCCNAACYYSPVNPEACADAIYKVATNKIYSSSLVINGKNQLKKFDNYGQRADKLIGILEEIAKQQ